MIIPLMGLFDKLSSASGKAFGNIGSAVKRAGEIGHKAVKLAGDIGNGVAGVYNKVNGYTNGALGELLQSVPGGKPALAAGSKALRFYNQQIAPRSGNIAQTMSDVGDKVSAYRL